MPGFGILVLIGCVALWFLLAFLYKPIGKFLYRIFKDAADELNDNETKE